MRRPALFCVVLACSLLAACGLPAARPPTPAPVSEKPFQKDFSADDQASCKAAQRALLGDGFLVETAGHDKLKGRKFFRVDNERGNVVEMTITCLANTDGSSTVFANAVRSHFELKKSSSSASVGVSVFGSLSLPIGQSADGMVKTTDETITDPAFYREFFNTVGKSLEENRSERPR